MMPIEPRSVAGFVALCAAGALSMACGTNRPTIPEELLHDDAGSGSGNYPAGPYCTSTGDCVAGATVENFTFAKGWTNPKAQGFDLSQLKPISFSDFYDANGIKTEILIVNTTALWCGACKNEHEGTATSPSLSDHVAALGPRGLALLSLLFEDAQNRPATEAQLQLWAQTYGTSFPFALDPDYQMGRYAPSQNAPLNLVIDARTMKILHVYVGDQSDVIWPFVEAELSKRESQ
jgi:hypothetical protein